MTQLFALIMADWESRGDRLVTFATGLKALGYTIYASDGTARFFMDSGIFVEYLSTLTGFDAKFDKMLKSKHHRVYAGLVAGNTAPDEESLRLLKAPRWSLVFISSSDVKRELTLPNPTAESVARATDVGGLTSLYAAAVQGRRIVLYSPDQCAYVLELLRTHQVFPQNIREQLIEDAAQHAVSQMAAAADFQKRLAAAHNDTPKR